MITSWGGLRPSLEEYRRLFVLTGSPAKLIDPFPVTAAVTSTSIQVLAAMLPTVATGVPA